MGKSTRLQDIEKLLENFGADTTERVEDLLDERERIINGKFCPICSSKQTEQFAPYCSVDCQTHDNLLM